MEEGIVAAECVRVICTSGSAGEDKYFLILLQIGPILLAAASLGLAVYTHVGGTRTEAEHRRKDKKAAHFNEYCWPAVQNVLPALAQLESDLAALANTRVGSPKFKTSLSQAHKTYRETFENLVEALTAIDTAGVCEAACWADIASLREDGFLDLLSRAANNNINSEQRQLALIRCSREIQNMRKEILRKHADQINDFV